MPYTQKICSSLFYKNKLARFLIVLAIIFVSVSKSLFAQELPESTPIPFRSNIVHGGLGFAGLIATATINYERIVTQHFDKFITATYAKVGYGAYASWGDDGQYLFLQYGILTGKKASHFEVSAGPNFTIRGDDLNLPVAFGLGYRLQKPGKPFMLRTGIAFPETLYFGMGLSF